MSPWGRARQDEEAHMRSLLTLDSMHEVVFFGAVTFEGAWVWGHTSTDGPLVAYPAHRVIDITQLPDENP